MKRLTAMAWMFVGLAGISAPQTAYAWEAKNELFRCFYFNAVRVCYGASTTVFPDENAQGRHESCDIRGMDDDPGIYSVAGLVATGNALYGPGYVDLEPGHGTGFRRSQDCVAYKATASYEGMTNTCVNGGPYGWTHTSEHRVRWRDGAHAWRGDNIHTWRSKLLPWPISSCNCGENGGGAQQ